MPKFIFTYGSNSKTQPYKGGWTEVIAEDPGFAVRAFNSFHPKTKDGLVNCAFIYSEEDFLKTDMAKKHSSFGHSVREIITATHVAEQLNPDDIKDTAYYRREVIDVS